MCTIRSLNLFKNLLNGSSVTLRSQRVTNGAIKSSKLKRYLQSKHSNSAKIFREDSWQFTKVNKFINNNVCGRYVPSKVFLFDSTSPDGKSRVQLEKNKLTVVFYRPVKRFLEKQAAKYTTKEKWQSSGALVKIEITNKKVLLCLVRFNYQGMDLQLCPVGQPTLKLWMHLMVIS